MLNRKNTQPSILYPAMLSFRIEGEIENFPEKKTKQIKQKVFVTTKPAMQEMLKGSH